MPIKSLDHIYVETHDWDAAAAFWEGLGFAFAERWGEAGHRAGRLVAGSAAVVLAEVPWDREPALDVFFSLDAADEYVPAPSVEVERPLSDTHWGTRWMRVKDPQGFVFTLEEIPEDRSCT